MSKKPEEFVTDLLSERVDDKYYDLPESIKLNFNNKLSRMSDEKDEKKESNHHE